MAETLGRLGERAHISAARPCSLAEVRDGRKLQICAWPSTYFWREDISVPVTYRCAAGVSDSAFFTADLIYLFIYFFCLSGASRKDQPSFTLKQVSYLCERLLKDHEEKIREEYEQILNTKLAGNKHSSVENTLKAVKPLDFSISIHSSSGQHDL